MRKIKFQIIVSLIFSICLSPLYGAGNPEDTVFSIKLNNVEIREVLKQIKDKTDFDFIYNTNELNDKQKVSLNITDGSINEILDVCFLGLNIEYSFKENIIILKKGEIISSPQESTQQEDIIMSGTVVDESGNPIPYVTVILSDTNIGAITDDKGRFIIKISPKYIGQSLRFSFIGMMEESIKVVSSVENLTITLKNSDTEIDDVIITGMETVKRDRMTGSTYTVTSEELSKKGVNTIDRLLDGVVPGLNSTTTSGAPGAGAKITIRGENNLKSNTEPLWIVDGLPLMSGVPVLDEGVSTDDYTRRIMEDGVGNIMPNDIESITILKDASATAIYGARAANGVIVIETKRGFISETQVDYTGTFGISVAPSNNLNFMNSSQKLEYENLLVQNFGTYYAEQMGRGGYLARQYSEGYISQSDYDNEIYRLSQINTDWFDEIFRTAISHTHNVSVRGGTEKFTYYSSLSYQDQDGILLSNSYQNTGVLSKFTYHLRKNLSLSMNVSANSRKTVDHASAIDPFTYAVFANPYEQVYDENGNYAADLSYLSDNYNNNSVSGYEYDDFNIIREITENTYTQTGLDAEITFNLQYEPIEGLKFESIFRKGFSYTMSQCEYNEGTYTSWINDEFLTAAYPYAEILPSGYNNGELNEGAGRSQNWAIRNQVTFNKEFEGGHYFSILLANEVMNREYNSFDYTSPIYDSIYRITGIPTFEQLSDLSYADMYDAISDMFGTNEGQDRSVSFISSLRYSYQDKYVANINFRTDGVDVIGDENQFTPLYSIGLRYNMHKEDFFKNNLVTSLSLRGSYGYTGNIDTSAYPFSTMTMSSLEYMGNNIVDELGFPNPTVSWETKLDRNIGVDFSLLNKIKFTVDYYSNRTEDILETLTLAPSTGRTSVVANGGIVENNGIELMVNADIFRTKLFSFSVAANVAHNNNIIVKSMYSYSSYQEAIEQGNFTGGTLNVEGEATGSVYGLRITGVNPLTGNPQFALSEEGKQLYANFLDGFDDLSDSYKEMYASTIASFNDIPDNVDFVKTDVYLRDFVTASYEYLGSLNPDLTGGFSTYLTYKNIDFTTSWTFKTGHIIPTFNDYANAPQNGYSLNDLAVSGTNREVKFLDFWQAAGDITSVSAFQTSSDYYTSYVTSENYVDGDYLRLTNLAINYRFLPPVLDKLGLRSLSVGVNASNLLTFTKYSGLDVGTGGAFTYPVSREFSLKVMIGF